MSAIEDVLAYRVSLKRQMVRVFRSLYLTPKRQDYIPALEARRNLEDILGLDRSYKTSRLLTEILPEIRYYKTKYAGNILLRPRGKRRGKK